MAESERVSVEELECIRAGNPTVCAEAGRHSGHIRG